MVDRRSLLVVSSAARLGATGCGASASTAAAAAPSCESPDRHRDVRTRAFELTFMRFRDLLQIVGSRRLLAG